MGQKVNPTGFRLPVNRAWRSRWFAPKKTFGAFLVEDQQIREYVKKRFVVGESEFFSDLVFYHRTLKCMVAVELKKGAFKPAYLGQLDFYLACLDKYVKLPDENPSIGLLLCHSMDRPVAELAVRRYSMPLGVATYRTSEDVPPAYKELKPLLAGSQRLLEESVAVDPVRSRRASAGRPGRRKPH